MQEVIYKLQYNNYDNWITWFQGEDYDKVYSELPKLEKYTNKPTRIVKIMQEIIYLKEIRI